MIKCNCGKDFEPKNPKPWPDFHEVYAVDCPHCGSSNVVLKRDGVLRRSKGDEIKQAKKKR